jgi:hypothetical protein
LQKLNELKADLERRMEAELSAVRDRYSEEIKALETVMGIATRMKPDAPVRLTPPV